MIITRNGVQVPFGLIGDGPIQVDPVTRDVTCNGSNVFTAPEGVGFFRIVNGFAIRFFDDGQINVTQPNGVQWTCSVPKSKSTESSLPTSTDTTKDSSQASTHSTTATTTKSSRSGKASPPASDPATSNTDDPKES